MQSKVPTYTAYRKIRKKDGGFLIYLICSLRTMASNTWGEELRLLLALLKADCHIHVPANDNFSSCRPSALKGVDSLM